MSDTRITNVLQGPYDPSVFLKKHWLSVVVGLCAAVIFGIWGFNAFHDRGYAPEQPIRYSHKLHAGDLGIDCKYCHFNAERGKHAGIPPTSVCLGCHGTDKGAVNADKPEIQKLIALAANDQGTYQSTDGIHHDGSAIHWNRVHKLPDFVYFSHQWHVKAGVACQTCHGPVETMEVVRQHAKLTMGWCVDCHRKTNYVGGPDYDPKDPATFAVGTGNYDIIRERIKPDAVVEFADRQTKAHTDTEAATGHQPVAHAPDTTGHAGYEAVAERPFGTFGAPTPKQDELVAGIVRSFPQLADLPNWRISELPETHQAVYRELIEARSGRALDQLTSDEQRQWLLQFSFQNSPTQCSTCHQ